MPTFIAELVEGFTGYVAREGGPDGSIKTLYEQGQHPKYLVFACADSRSAPEIICDLNAGDDFDLRWGGPFIPAYDQNDTFSGMMNDHLDLFLSKGIKEIAIIAHEDCAAAGNVAQTRTEPANTLQKVGAPFLDAAKNACNHQDSNALHRAIEGQVVITGLKNLQTYPGVQKALAGGQIHLHGLMFAMGEQALKKYYPEDDEFRIIAQNPKTAHELTNKPE